MSVEKKIENEINKNSLNRGKQTYANEMKRNGAIWELSHVKQAMKVGAGEKPLSTSLNLQKAVVNEYLIVQTQSSSFN